MMDEQYMKLVMELAKKAEGYTSPNPMVGALVVRAENIVGRGYHARAGAAHAEIMALNEAGERAEGATLYVNLEPCCHYGRTGPCVEMIIAAKIKKVVIAMVDPNPLVAGKSIALLRQSGVIVITGVLENEARRLNEVFIKYITTGIPFVALKAAMSLDGKIATRLGESQWITSGQARLFGHYLRHRYDAILASVNTVILDNPSLTTRLPKGGGKDPIRIIVDSRARTPPEAKIITQRSSSPTLIAVTKMAPAERVATLRKAGAEVFVMPEENQRVSLKLLMGELAKKEITSVLIEGGGEVHASALKAGIVDKVYWFIAPKIIGGKEAPGPVGGLGIGCLTEAIQLKEVRVRRLGEDIGVEGYIIH
jgi:diaminohydroxyphosphoribosylaminopyrimidine deaminase/5-amino-6-(5-phosphoribosylamino)uracil reductase